MLVRAPTLFVGLRGERRVWVSLQELLEEPDCLLFVTFLSGDHPRFEKAILSRQRIDGRGRGSGSCFLLIDGSFDSAARAGRRGRGTQCTLYADLAMRARHAQRWRGTLRLV